ncbi:MAG: tetratricopeptide repeat protein, partial [Rectinema subterraneum]|uniref:tetratricopeptide repeat protein n=1 Tax=Rectinema subterraneum TaxID=2653714 RepID=UPI003C7BF5BE
MTSFFAFSCLRAYNLVIQGRPHEKAFCFLLVFFMAFAFASAQTSASDIASLRAEAENGDPIAQNTLGVKYYNGNGVTKDFAEAASWFAKAADQGNAAAQNNLAWLYEQGLGVAKDYEKALYWYRKAAERGYAYAQFSAGWFYDKGLGVQLNFQEAF